MTQHCPDLVSASECMRQIFNQSEDLGSDASSVWEFCASCSDVILKGNQWINRLVFIRPLAFILSNLTREYYISVNAILNLSGGVATSVQDTSCPQDKFTTCIATVLSDFSVVLQTGQCCQVTVVSC